MRIAFAFVFLILLWSTTPLAIKLSGQGPGFLFAVSARMAIGAFCMLLVLPFIPGKMPWHRQALHTYCAVALQMYASMLAVYWAAQYVPSGWISVIFGLTPFMTAILASLWLGEKSLTAGKLLAYAFGVSGLAVMFLTAIEFGHMAELGLAGVLIAAFLQSFSAVWVKWIDTRVPAFFQVTGGLLLALPCYFLTWLFVDQGPWPENLSLVSLASIVYLGVFATTFGFALYYYILIHLSATRVALITLVSPVLALLLGHRVNDEPLTLRIITGTFLILCALIIHSLAERRTGKS